MGQQRLPGVTSGGSVEGSGGQGGAVWMDGGAMKYRIPGNLHSVIGSLGEKTVGATF